MGILRLKNKSLMLEPIKYVQHIFIKNEILLQNTFANDKKSVFKTFCIGFYLQE